MKKAVIVFSLELVLFLCVGVVNADSTATGMGFSVDEQLYGIKKCYRVSDTFSYVVKNGVSYAIGYSKMKSAVYQDQTDDDWALVIMQSTAEPLDVKIPTGVFNIMCKYDSVTMIQDIYSDIDNSSISFGYGAYITSANFLMEQPSPRDEPDTAFYTASIEVGEEVKASGSVVFEDNELDLEFVHSSANNIFHARFLYGPVFLDASYMNGLTYNKGAFLVDLSTPNSSNAGVFVNTATLTTTFYSTFGGINGYMYIVSTPRTVSVYF